MNNVVGNYSLKTLTDDEFRRLSRFIFEHYGIKMPEAKRTILQCRLHKRLRELKMDNFSEYVNYVFSPEGQTNEVVHMMDVVSTNKTDFFREPDHFEFLSSMVLPEITTRNTFASPLNIWSAGCSSGEEAFTIAFTMEEYMAKNRSFDYHIYGTDISSKVLQLAQNAVYRNDRISVIPFELKKKYLLRSIDQQNPTVRIIPALRQKTTFFRLNLMETKYNLPVKMDVVFCRNVLIYFNRETQIQVLNNICSWIKTGGYLFLGHSESTTGMNLPLERLKPTIFRKI